MCCFCQQQISNSWQNFSFGYPLSKGNVMLCYKERHPLLLDYFVPSLKYIRMVGTATDSLHESLVVHSMSFLPITIIKFHANLRFRAPCVLLVGQGANAKLRICCLTNGEDVSLAKWSITWTRCHRVSCFWELSNTDGINTSFVLGLIAFFQSFQEGGGKIIAYLTLALLEKIRHGWCVVFDIEDDLEKMMKRGYAWRHSSAFNITGLLLQYCHNIVSLLYHWATYCHVPTICR